VLDFSFSLPQNLLLPAGIEVLYPFSLEETRLAMTRFYHQYFSDSEKMTFLFGINPGRFDAGSLTGTLTNTRMRSRKLYANFILKNRPESATSCEVGLSLVQFHQRSSRVHR
jgi:hypothetical protein